MANLIAATEDAEESGDIVISAGTTVNFAVIGTFNGSTEWAEIQLKGSDGKYKLMREEKLPGQIIEAKLNAAILSRGIQNNTANDITVKVVKTATGTAVGIDQY